MAAPSRFSPSELQAWRRGYGLTVRELAWVLGIPEGTLKDKLSGRHGPWKDTERAVDLIDISLHMGVPPPGWPRRLFSRIHVNKIG